MDCFAILAQAAGGAGAGAGSATRQITNFWEHVISLGQLEAFMFISFGVVWLFYGWRVFKVLVVISFALLGLGLGMAARRVIQGLRNPFVGGVVGMLTRGSLSI